MKVLSISMQKGGVGKTTSSINIGAALSRKGYKVLLIDCDPQGNMSQSLGISTVEKEHTLSEVLTGHATVDQAIVTAVGYDVLPTDIRQAGVENYLAEKGDRFILRKNLYQVADTYDYIILDCPPSLGFFTIMCLVAATHVLIPVQSQYLALQGGAQLMQTINVVGEEWNPEIKVAGVFLTMYDGRKNMDVTAAALAERIFPRMVLRTRIPNNVSLAAAGYHEKDVYQYDAKCKGAVKYTELVDEVLSILET